MEAAMASSAEYARRKRIEQLKITTRTLDALKLDSGCVDCGFAAHPNALHFDHRERETKRRDLGWYDDRSKLVTPGRLARYLAHVDAYCDIRCANCHAIRTATEKHWLPKGRQPSLAPMLF